MSQLQMNLHRAFLLILNVLVNLPIFKFRMVQKRRITMKIKQLNRKKKVCLNKIVLISPAKIKKMKNKRIHKMSFSDKRVKFKQSLLLKVQQMNINIIYFNKNIRSTSHKCNRKSSLLSTAFSNQAQSIATIIRSRHFNKSRNQTKSNKKNGMKYKKFFKTTKHRAGTKLGS